MFTRFSVKRSRILAAGLVALTLLAVGCSQPTDPTPTSTTSLSVYYKSSYGDGFEISGTTFTQYDDAAKGISYAGTIVNAPNLSAASGIIIVKITNAGTWGKTVGKFCAVAWKDRTEQGMKESSAFKAGSAFNNGADTQAIAETEFTEEKGYFPSAYFGQYLKQ